MQHTAFCNQCYLKAWSEVKHDHNTDTGRRRGLQCCGYKHNMAITRARGATTRLQQLWQGIHMLMLGLEVDGLGLKCTGLRLGLGLGTRGLRLDFHGLGIGLGLGPWGLRLGLGPTGLDYITGLQLKSITDVKSVNKKHSCLAVKHQFKNQLSCCTREIKPFCEIVALICWGNCYRTSADWRNAFGNSVWPFCHLHHLHLVLDSPLISIFWSGSPQQHYVKCGASLKIFCFPFWNKDTRT